MKDRIINATLAIAATASLAIPTGPALAWCPTNTDSTTFNNCMQQQRRQRDIEFRMQQLERQQRQQQHRSIYGY